MIRRMSIENPLWGAPRIHGELLKLGFEVAQSSVAKYMVKRRGPPSQGWRTFLRNHAPDIAAVDLLVVPSVRFDLLYAFVVVRLDRRDLVWIDVTTNPTAEWIARQLTEAFPWDEAPKYLIRDRDGIYGTVVTRRIQAMGIRDRPTAPASPWQNGYAERLIGSIRRECLDYFIVSGEAHLSRILRSPGSPWQNGCAERLIGTVRRECLDRMLIFGEAHLRRILTLYACYYNEKRTHLSLQKDAPLGRAVQRYGTIVATPVLAGLHHRYARYDFRKGHPQSKNV